MVNLVEMFYECTWTKCTSWWTHYSRESFRFCERTRHNRFQGFRRRTRLVEKQTQCSLSNRFWRGKVMHSWNDNTLGADPFGHDPPKVWIKGYLQRWWVWFIQGGLFYQQLPTKTFNLKGERCAREKFSKVRLTGLAAGNGVSEKLPMLVIGKAKKPQCFKGVKNLLSRS